MDNTYLISSYHHIDKLISPLYIISFKFDNYYYFFPITVRLWVELFVFLNVFDFSKFLQWPKSSHGFTLVRRWQQQRQRASQTEKFMKKSETKYLSCIIFIIRDFILNRNFIIICLFVYVCPLLPFDLNGIALAVMMRERQRGKRWGETYRLHNKWRLHASCIAPASSFPCITFDACDEPAKMRKRNRKCNSQYITA